MAEELRPAAAGRTDPDPVDVAVVGAGVVGLGIAWAAAQSGRSVRLIDPHPAAGASFAAAGMLAPVSELHYQEEELLELTLASAELYPEFIERLAGTGEPAAGTAPLTGTGPLTATRPPTAGAADATGYRTTRTLVLGADAADRQVLTDLRAVQLRHGLSVEPLTVRQARALEPLLGTQLSCAFSIGTDHQVDPRALARALTAALTNHARARAETDPVLRQNALGLLHADPADPESAVTGVRLADGSVQRAAEVVVANGLGASGLTGLPPALDLPLRPVHGDILRLRVPERLRPLLTATVRGLVRGVPVYLVPRTDGTVVLGATQREDGSGEVSAGGIYQLLRDAQVLVPAVAELELLEATARARPGTPDNAPLLGRVAGAAGTDIPGLIIATGFFRHGILLTPIAARICRALMDGSRESRWERFRPDRFSPSSLLPLTHPTSSLRSPQ